MESLPHARRSAAPRTGFRPDEDAPGAAGAIILGYGVWEKRYGADSSILGHTLPVNGQPHTVVAVMPKGFMFPERQEAWVPSFRASTATRATSSRRRCSAG